MNVSGDLDIQESWRFMKHVCGGLVCEEQEQQVRGGPGRIGRFFSLHPMDILRHEELDSSPTATNCFYSHLIKRLVGIHPLLAAH